MLKVALLAALAYWLMWSLDNLTGVQTISRPIIIGTFTGIIMGDIRTGIIIGATLEGVFLGIMGVGGVSPSDPRSATVVSTALAIGTGLDLESGVAVAITVAALMNTFNVLVKTVENALHPLFMKLAVKGEYKKFRIGMYLDLFLIKAGLPSLAIGLITAIGATSMETILSVCPAFITRGLNSAASMLIVVGLAVMCKSISSPITGVFLLLGFILSKYLGLSSIVIAGIGFIIAFLSYRAEIDAKNTAAVSIVSNDNEEDDFYD